MAAFSVDTATPSAMAPDSVARHSGDGGGRAGLQCQGATCLAKHVLELARSRSISRPGLGDPAGYPSASVVSLGLWDEGRGLSCGRLVDDLSTASLVDEQVAYYHARAPEYDAWWLREGHFDLGEVFNAASRARGGTSLRRPGSLRADRRWLNWLRGPASGPSASPIMPTASRPRRLSRDPRHQPHQALHIAHAHALFGGRHLLVGTGRRYDVVCFSFWLTHVPVSCFGDFWDRVDRR